MRWAAPLLGALALALAPPAGAGMLLFGVGPVGGGAPAGFQGVGDIVSGATAYYSCARAYTLALGVAHTQLCNVRNTGTNETCDILAATSGYANLTAMASCSGSSTGVSLATFCTGGCAVVTVYDETGHAHNITNATTSHQPTLTVSCFNALPCISIGVATISLASAGNFTPSTGVVSFLAVGNRSTGTTGGSFFLQENGNNNSLRTATSANKWSILTNGSATISVAGNDATWHAGNGAINGASSFLNIDGTVGTGTITGNTTAAAITSIGTASTNILETEMAFYDATAFTTGQATSLCENEQASYGGGANFGGVC